ncbi:MAG: ATP-binding protein [Verrucomicrobia bacterium]|nr:ATP-binding protein [Verrucomicrobiota bacterium]
MRRDAEAFIPRQDLIAELENEVVSPRGCPGILLYGRRRLGKSTLLRNLEGFLPDKVLPMIVSMQNPEAFTSEADLIETLAREIGKGWSPAEKLAPRPKDLRTLFQFLDACEAGLEREDRRLLLAVDEFEAIDRTIGEGQMTEDLLAALRESIQSHRRICWLFAGSHDLHELPDVRWTSYFVSVRTAEMHSFTLEETRLLLTDPLKHSPRAEARTAAGRAKFGGTFWGEVGIDTIHEQAGGWPHLVQAIAATVVDLCNLCGRATADPGLIDEALSKTVVSSGSVLAELMLYRSVEFPETWDYLARFRARDEQPPPEDDVLRRRLKRYLLVTETPSGHWRLRVPLMQRWLRERA